MRFAQITPDMALLRETHRHVLSWTHLEPGKALAFTIHLGKDDLSSLRRALDARRDAHAAPIDWRSERGDLRIEGHGEGLTLGFAAVSSKEASSGATSAGAGSPEVHEIQLDAEATRRLEDALQEQR